MWQTASVLVLLAVMLAGCDSGSEDSSGESSPASSEAEGTADEEPAPPAPLPPEPEQPQDLVKGQPPAGADDPEALCAELLPGSPGAYGVGEDDTEEHRLEALDAEVRVPFDHYASSVLRCAWKSASGLPSLEVSIECGYEFDEAFCKKQIAGTEKGIEAAQKGDLPGAGEGGLYEDPVEGAVCHTMSAKIGGNSVFLENGCFFTVSGPAIAKPDDREHMYAVGTAVAANVEPPEE